MNVHLLCKRYYTNKDLLQDRYGRLYHLPTQLVRLGAVASVTAIDYRGSTVEQLNAEGVTFRTAPATPVKLPGLLPHLNRTIPASRPDLLIASGDSHIGYIGSWIAERLRIPFVFDVYDYYPAFRGNRIPGMKAMFKSSIKKARRVLCASEQLRRRVSKLNENALVIENGVDRQLFAPGDMREARLAFNLDLEAPLIGYFGSITPTRGPLLIDACRLLRKEMPSLNVVLAGPTTQRVDEPWIRYLGPLPQTSVVGLIRACDVVTVPYAPDSFNNMAGASKIPEYLACRKPVVATRVSDHEEIFKAAPTSLCDPEPEDMARALRRQLTNPVIAPFPHTLGWESIARRLYESLSTIGP